MLPSDAIEVGKIDGIVSFVQHIDWTEPWLIALLSFHTLCLLLTFITRKRTNVQVGYFLGLLALIYMSETINEHAAENHKLFSRQQYFDPNGLFIAVVLSAPLLCNCLVIIILWLYQSMHLLVHVKRAELRQQQRNGDAKQK